MALTPRELVARLNTQDPQAGWVWDKKGRRAYSIITGRDLSRRQLEKMPGGRLAEEGFTSFEAKAKARRSLGLTGARQVRPGVYEIDVSDPRKRKAVLQSLPERSNVRVLVRGYVEVGRWAGGSGDAGRHQWRHMNFAPKAGKAAWMSPSDILSVWDNRASRAGKVVRNPERWKIRVSVPPT